MIESLEIQLQNKKEENQTIARKFHLTNKEHQKLFNESVLLNGLVHKKKQKKIQKIQIIEKKKYKQLLKIKEAQFKEDIQEKLRQTGIFIPGITQTSELNMNNKNGGNGANDDTAKKSKIQNNHIISEIIHNKTQKHQISGFYVNYSSESKSNYVSEDSLDDEDIKKRLEEMADEKNIQEKVQLEEDLDEISLDIDDPHTFTLGRNDHQLENLNTNLSYVDNKIRYKADSKDMVGEGDDQWDREKVIKKKKKGRDVSLSMDEADVITKKRNWSEADSFSADSEEGIYYTNN